METDTERQAEGEKERQTERDRQKGEKERGTQRYRQVEGQTEVTLDRGNQMDG